MCAIDQFIDGQSFANPTQLGKPSRMTSQHYKLLPIGEETHFRTAKRVKQSYYRYTKLGSPMTKWTIRTLWDSNPEVQLPFYLLLTATITKAFCLQYH